MAGNSTDVSPTGRNQGFNRRPICTTSFTLHLGRGLADARAEFGGFAAQLNHLSVVIGLSVTDHAWIAVTYDIRTHKAGRELVKSRPTRADYFELSINLNKDVKAGVVRDFEARLGEMYKEKEKAAKEKATKGKPPPGANGKGRRRGENRRGGRKWTPGDWGEWNAIRAKQTEEPKAPAKREPAAGK